MARSPSGFPSVAFLLRHVSCSIVKESVVAVIKRRDGEPDTANSKDERQLSRGRIRKRRAPGGNDDARMTETSRRPNWRMAQL